MRLRTATWLMQVVFVAGCVMGPDYRRPAVDVPTAFGRAQPDQRGIEREAGAPTGSDAALPIVGGVDLVDTAWWSSFGDPRLDELIRISLDENKDLRIAAYRIEQHDAMLQVTRAAGLPQATYGGARTRDALSQNRQVRLTPGTYPVDNNYEIGVSARWEIDLWGRVSRANEAALADLLATEDDRRSLVTSLVAKVASNYLQLLAVDREIELLQVIVKSQRDGVQLLDAKFRGGRISELPVVAARAEMEDLLAALEGKKAEAATLEHALSLLTGRNPGAIERGGPLEALKLPPLPSSVPAQVLVRRYDVRKAEQQLVAANARIGVAKAQYLPAVSLVAQQGFASSDLSKLLALSSNVATFGVAILGPLFDGGRIEGQVRESEALQRASTTAYLQTVQVALREVEDALVWHQQSRQQAAARDRQVDALRLQLDLTNKREKGGASDLIDVVRAERTLYEGQMTQSQSRRDHALSLIAVYKAMGGSWSVADHFPPDLRTTKAEHD